jgi:hypothetical protein
VSVGDVEALEGGEDVRAGRLARSALGEKRQALVLLVIVVEGLAELGFEQSEDQQGDPDDRDQCVDAVVVV